MAKLSPGAEMPRLEEEQQKPVVLHGVNLGLRKQGLVRKLSPGHSLSLRGSCLDLAEPCNGKCPISRT